MAKTVTATTPATATRATAAYITPGLSSSHCEAVDGPPGAVLPQKSERSTVSLVAIGPGVPQPLIETVSANSRQIGKRPMPSPQVPSNPLASSHYGTAQGKAHKKQGPK